MPGGEGKLLGFPEYERRVRNLLFGLIGTGPPQHFGCQVDAPDLMHARRERQNIGAGSTRNIEHDVGRLRLGKIHFFVQDLRRIAHRECGECFRGLRKLLLDGFFVFFGHIAY